MFENALSSETKQLLMKIAPVVNGEGFYLAGGTGLALQLGHRLSQDLDFFRRNPFDPNRLLSNLRHRVDSVKEVVIEAGTLLSRLDEIRCSFFLYDVPLLFEGFLFCGVKVADWRDIAVEKIKTIAQRGSKKDFYDVFFAIRSGRLTIEEAVSLFKRRFESTGINFYHVLRSLTYFEEAEEEPDPMVVGDLRFNWSEVVSFFRRHIHEFERHF